MRLALIGCGALGSYVARAVSKGLAGDYHLVSVYDVNPAGARELSEELGCALAETVSSLLHHKPAIVVEAARREAVWEHGEQVLRSGASLVVLSSGALADDAFRERLMGVAQEHRIKIYVPAGAVGALDLVQAAAVGQFAARIDTRKPPKALLGAPFVKGVDLETLQTPVEVFNGSVHEGIEAFPQNINVAVSTALATGDLSRVGVTVSADPSLTVNVHRIAVEGDFGRATVEIASRAIPGNPKSSALAAMSVVALLRKIQSPLQVG